MKVYKVPRGMFRDGSPKRVLLFYSSDWVMFLRHKEGHDNFTNVNGCFQGATSIHSRYHTARTARVFALLPGFTNSDPAEGCLSNTPCYRAVNYDTGPQITTIK